MNVIEEYEERKRLRRSRFRWRVIAALAMIVAVLTVLSQQKPTTGQHIARYAIDGVITDDKVRDKALKDIAGNKKIEALIVSIDSPGGTIVGSEILYESLRKVAEEKPVVAVMRNVAASGGYMAAIAADHIIARGNTITGSIGVIAQAPNAHNLLDRIGISILEVKSGPLKAQPSPFQPVTPEALDAQQDMVAESYNWFLDLVTSRRALSEKALGQIRDGGVFTGRQARDISLIDDLGGEEDAVAWLESDRGIEKDRKIIDYGQQEKEFLEDLADRFGMVRSDRPVLSTGLYAIYR